VGDYYDDEAPIQQRRRKTDINAAARGAVPAVELAILDSGVQTLKEQGAADRQSFGRRMDELRSWRERLESAQAVTAAQTARTADCVSRLEAREVEGAHSLAELADAITAIELAQAYTKGGLKVVGALALAVPVLIAILEHVVTK
jgi:hypothetical protein